jgi:LmbE family N-acetylglucosaminyl deacetylase
MSRSTQTRQNQKASFRVISWIVLSAVLCAMAFIPHSAAVEAAVTDKASLHQALLDLTNSWTVMCVAAHPDDEDGTTLTVLRRKYGVHTVSLFSTYGEGGQNAIGPELYEDLGVIRARETMRAAEIQGSEPYFLGLRDFGFSKSAEEAFRIWGHEEALRRMVLKIRELRPDVIITNHDTTRGHGHHQATGQLIIEAFEAAADRKRFPEQLEKVEPWQAQRLFVRQFRTESSDRNLANRVVSIDPNEVDPVRGSSFAAQALQALQKHASQGPWPKSIAEMLRSRRAEGGKLPPIRYTLERSAPEIPALPESPGTFFDGLGPAPAPPNSELLTVNGKPLIDAVDQPDAVLDALIKARLHPVENPGLADPEWEMRIGNAFAQAAGLSMTLSADKPVLMRGDKRVFTIALANSGSKPINISKLTLTAFGKELSADPPETLLPDTEATVTLDVMTPADAASTVPSAEHLYDGSVFGARFKATAYGNIEEAPFQISTNFSEEVVPAVEITKISPAPCVRTEETLGRCRELILTLSNHAASPFRGKIKVSLDRDRGLASDVSRPLVMLANQTSTELALTSNKIPRPVDLRGLRRSRSAVVTIYGPADEVVTEEKVSLVYTNARTKPNLRVGYVPSFDQTLEQSLAALGVEAKALNAGELQNADLSSYHTIILDNRAYEAHPELIAANSKLLGFANAGGTLIVFYHKSNEWNPDASKQRPQLAPYPIILGDERVTDETAPISFLQPRHRLLNFPNRITRADFDDWIQERGLYYPKEWDNHYAALFSTNDNGEAALKGGLLVAKYGKGNYIYTSLVWYRQLRAGVPGAYKMFANLISY